MLARCVLAACMAFFENLLCFTCSMQHLRSFLMAMVGIMAGAYCLPAQSTFSPYKVTLFEDAALVASKGIMNFKQQKASLPMPLPVISESIHLVSGVSDARLTYFKLWEDSVPGKLAVGTWGEVLEANLGKRLTIVYDAGMEVDEVTGEAKVVNKDSGMLLLRGSDDSQYFIPFAEIKQVIIMGQANFQSSKKVPQTMLEIAIDKDVPFVPMEMHSVHKGISWIPVGRIRIVNTEKALLQLSAVIQNDLAPLDEVEVELCASEILNHGHQNGEVVPAGKFSLKKGERLALNLKETELEYNAAYQCQIPWSEFISDGSPHRIPVQNFIRFNVTSLPGLQCESYHILDENNRQLAQIPLTPNSKNGQLELLLGEEQAVYVNVLETVVKEGKKVEKIGEFAYTRVSIQGKVTLFNAGQKFLQIQVQRDLKGEIMVNEKAKVEENQDEPGMKSMIWRFSLEKGAKKEVAYQYDAFLPAKEK